MSKPKAVMRYGRKYPLMNHDDPEILIRQIVVTVRSILLEAHEYAKADGDALDLTTVQIQTEGSPFSTLDVILQVDGTRRVA